eukprot:RCo031479
MQSLLIQMFTKVVLCTAKGPPTLSERRQLAPLGPFPTSANARLQDEAPTAPEGQPLIDIVAAELAEQFPSEYSSGTETKPAAFPANNEEMLASKNEPTAIDSAPENAGAELARILVSEIQLPDNTNTEPSADPY